MVVNLKHKKTLVFITVFVLIALTGIKIIYTKLNSPDLGKVSSQPSTIQNTPSFDLKPKLITSKYASFQYPEAINQVANNKLVTPVVAMFNFSYHDTVTWNLAIDILNIPSGELTDNDSYKVRVLNPSIYSPSQLKIGNKTFPVMSDKTAGDYSKVAFLVDGQYQATVSLSGDDINGYAPLDSTLNLILSSWQWQPGY